MIVAGIIYLIFGIVGKTSAVFIAIPYPVLGGALIVMFGMFVGVALSSLQVVDLKSTRNLAVLGIAVIVGLLMPFWIEKRKDSISFGKVYVLNSHNGWRILFSKRDTLAKAYCV